MSEKKYKSTLPYDITNAMSIFGYSKGLLGKTLRQFAWEGYMPKKGKGSLGQMVENLYFLLETNNYAGADFSEAGMELKCTPLKKSKQDDYLIKERLVCNMRIRFPSSTIRQHEFPKTQILYTTYSQTNSWNHLFSSSLMNTRANAWNAECHQGNGNIAVQRLVHLSKLRASAPS